MARYPRESNSSEATSTMIAVVVILVLGVGMLAMVGLGLFFYLSLHDAGVRVVERPAPEQEIAEVLAEDEGLDQPSPMPPFEESETAERKASERESEIDGRGLLDRAEDADIAETSDQRDVIAAGPSEASESLLPIDAPSKRLADLQPLETLNVLLDDAPIFRSVNIDGQIHADSLWAQPTTDLGSCQISFPLEKAYRRLTGWAAIADAEREGSSSPAGTFRVYGDGNLLWDSELLEGYGTSRRLDIDVQGIRLVVLVVESDAPANISFFTWADLRLAPI